MTAPSSPTPKTLAAAPQHYWAIVRRQFFRSRLGVAGLAVFLTLAVVALLAPLLANDVPIIARYRGRLCFPAFPSYLDAFPVPRAVADWLRREVKIGDNNVFSEAYPILEGRSWKQAISEDWSPERGDWYWAPPVFFSYKEIQAFKLRPGERTRWGREDQPELASTHHFGTDGHGRDVLARLIHGTVISLSVGVVAVSIYVAIGVVLGLLAGYFGGWVDHLLSRITEVIICFPTFFLIITVIAFLPRSIYNIMVVIGLTSWPGVFRLMRGEVLRVKALDYCTASQALGASPARVMLRHLFPNAVQPVFVAATFGVASAILTENALSFLGFGVAPPTASWGEIVSQGREYVVEGLFYLATVPGLAIFVTVTAINLVGQALRDAMDPRLRK
jgi:peptide/nickel transport system permease protein